MPGRDGGVGRRTDINQAGNKAGRFRLERCNTSQEISMAKKASPVTTMEEASVHDQKIWRGNGGDYINVTVD